MPLAFSFFNTSFLKSREPEAVKDPVPESPKQAPEAPKSTPSSPFPVRSPFAGSSLFWTHEHSPTLPAETVLIQEKEVPPILRMPEPTLVPSLAEGIAGRVVNETGPEAPPLNAKKVEPEPIFPQERNPAPPPVFELPPSASEANPTELEKEIEQVRNDLFGAVMGVSALKDRLDGLEQQVAALPPPAPSLDVPTRTEIESWAAHWLDQHLGAAMEDAFVTIMEKVAIKSHLKLPFTPADASKALSQPPIILTVTPL